MFDLTVTMERDGGRCKLGSLDARIICTDLLGDEPLVVAVDGDDGAEFVLTRALDGSGLNDGGWITTLPETMVTYANLYSDGEIGAPHVSTDGCAKHRDTDRFVIGILKITITGVDDDWTVEKVTL